MAPSRIPSRRVVASREIKPQYKSKPNTEHRGVYQKKKKSPIHKPKSNPINHLPMDGHVTTVVAAVSSSSSSSFAWSPLIADRRSENADHSASAPVLGVRRSVLLPALRQGISLFFLSDSFSISRSLIFISLKLKRKCIIADRHRRHLHRLIALRLCLCSGERCSLPPPAIRPSLKVSL